jgi:hypothetical protein
MNGCKPCEESLSYCSPLTIYLVKSNGDILVYARNNGRNIVIIKRLLLCREWSSGGKTINFLREPDFIVGDEKLEQGSTQLKFRASGVGAISAQATAEYFEVTGRSLSCELNLSSMEVQDV